MKPFYSKVVLAVLASVCLGGISRAGVLEQKLASLPVFDELASVKTPFDWLVSPEKSAAGVYVSPDWKSLVVANAMVWRTFRIYPNLATTDYVNRMTGERMLRAVGSEGSVTIDSVAYSIGGLEGQPERGYLVESWIETLRPVDGAFTVEDFEVRPVEPAIR